MKRIDMLRMVLFTVIAAMVIPFSAVAADTIKIAHLDPMSGPFANVGMQAGHQLQAVINEINAKGGVLGARKFEIVSFDNQAKTQESLVVLGKALDQGIHFVTQGASSSAAAAISESLTKTYQRNPEKAAIFLNYTAIDPGLTNENCNFWHFRFSANADMKLEAMTNYLAKNKSIKKVYIIGQDYSFGQAVSRTAKEMLAQKRPDIEIVGDDLHPIGKVKDFSPYVAKIRASGADAVITGNWGNDLALFIKAADESGLSVDYYTIFGGAGSTPPAIGAAGVGHLKSVSDFHLNIADSKIGAFTQGVWDDFKTSFYYISMKYQMEMLAKAIDKAQSTDPLKVAKALEGMRYQGDFGEVWMRPEDHQLMLPQYISTYGPAGPDQEIKHDIEGSGFGFKTDARIEAADGILPTSCKMVRP